MHELDRIESALASKPLNHQLFERCAQDLLVEIYPGLSPIPGGTDWGRDADIHGQGEPAPARLLVTASRSLDGVRKNMLAGIRSMREHNVPSDRLVLSTPAQLSQHQRNGLVQSAKRQGAVVEAVYDRGFFASRLRRDGEWRTRLLGLSGDPITLSRLPVDLAESPWAALPLLGRDDELEEIRSTAGHLVLTGPPGVGKTRLLAAVERVVFVDPDAAADRLGDDLRWAQPDVVVIDDAGSHEELIRRLVRLRQVESDVARYRLIAACWPDEMDKVRGWLPAAEVVELDLLDREDLDRLIVGMGITRQLAREEILDQAEGRPGWAVALGDVLLRARDATSLLSGRGLLGQVERYLRRAAIPTEAIDLLAAIAAVGSVDQTDLAALADELGMPPRQASDLLATVAKSGLIDVESVYDAEEGRSIRRYQVRPPMLADVLAAERAFVSDVPGIDLRSLTRRWPNKLPAIAQSAIDSALLGTTGARDEAEHLYHEALAASGVSARGKLDLSQHYARIDRPAADQVLRIIRTEFDRWAAGDTSSPRAVEPLLTLAYLLARWYLIEDAIRLLLDAAVLDGRQLNPWPGHPGRKLADLVHEFHPELPRPREHRELLARGLERWIEAEPSVVRWRVYGEVVGAVLSLHLRSTLSAPGDHRRFQWIETVADPTEIRWIYEQVWPPIRERAASAPAPVVKALIEVATDWLRVAYDAPFGRPHPQPSIDAATEFGERLIKDLLPLTRNHPGLIAHLRDVADLLDLSLDVEQSADPFFADVDRRDDWQLAVEQLQHEIQSAVEPWAMEDAKTVVARLLSIKTELGLSNIRWPDRVWMACEALAPLLGDPLAWADVALELGLFPEASPFLRRHINEGRDLGNDRLARYLSHPSARWEAIGAVLSCDGAANDRRYVMRSIAASDYQLLKTLVLRDQLSIDRRRELLAQLGPEARGATAAAMFVEGRGDRDGWTPSDLEAEWLEAILLLDPRATVGLQDYEAGDLVSFMASRYPEQLTRWIRLRVEAGLESREVYRALPHGVWQRLHLMPHDAKDELWTAFSDQPAVRWLLGRELVGNDIEWLGHAVDRGLLTAEEALETYNGVGLHASIEDLARLLAPRGVDTRRIAALAQGGTWVGEESHRYSQLLDQFSELSKSADQAVAAVGRAGTEMFGAARDEALRSERKKRIRGEL